MRVRHTGRVMLRLGWAYVAIVGAAIFMVGLVAIDPDGSRFWSAGFAAAGLGSSLLWLTPGLLLTASGGLLERRRYRRYA